MFTVNAICAGLDFDDTDNSSYRLSGGAIQLLEGDIKATSVGQTHIIDSDLMMGSGVWSIGGQTTLRVNGGLFQTAAGVGFEKTGSGVVELNIAGSTLTGDITLTGGTLKLGHSTVVQNNTVVIGGGTLDVTSNSINAIIGQLSGSGNLDIGSTSFTTGNNNTSKVYSGAITGNSGSRFTHDGTGRLTLSGSGHSLSDIRVLDGELVIKNGTMGLALKAGSTAMLGERGDVTISNGAVVTLPWQADAGASDGRGAFTFGAQLTVSGTNSRLEAGRLDFSLVGLNNASSLLIEDNGQVDVNLSSVSILVFGISNDFNTVSADATITSGGVLNARRIISGSELNDSATFLVTDSGSAINTSRFDLGGQENVGNDGGETSLSITNSGTVTATRMNLWSTASSVTVNGGSMVVGSLDTHGLLPSITISDAPGGGPALTIGHSSTATTIETPIGDAAGGAGSLTKVGNSTLWLNVASTYSGETVVEGGTLLISAPANGSPTGTGKVTLKNGSLLAGTGQIKGELAVDATGGTISPATALGLTTLNVENLTLSPAATLEMQLGSTGHDKIMASNSAVLGGMLDLAYNGSFVAAPGDEFVIVTGNNSLFGPFDTINYPDAQNWGIKYEYGLCTIFVTLPPCGPADLNGDGILDFFDVSVFLTAFSSGDLSVDFNGDGVLDFFDVSEFLVAFAAGC